ncbi:MAG: S8 family serine peptidase [Lysobacter sp.]|nr:S8 family serine peptidase [Lysobacter sp.]
MQLAAINDLSSNTAHGPALDGRRIPAMVAPGCSIDSANSATGHGLMCGTSMASPQVAGASALFVQYYRNRFSVDPSPALTKAAFTAVAQNLVGKLDADGGTLATAPDSKQGWGRMLIDPVLRPAQAVQYVDQSHVFDNTGESWTRTFTAADPTKPVRVMLVWTDAPGHGLGGTTPAWNNNLDLRVTAGGNTYLGNVFNSAGWSATGGTADARNNGEGVFLQAAQHGGSVNVVVRATDINSNGLPNAGDDTDQDFALVCYNCAASL